MPRKQSAQRIPDVDPKGPAGVALTDAVQVKLRQFLGADYVDRSLAQYVVVMLAHKTEQHQVAENLVEFLGEVDAKELASWLFESLDSLLEPPPTSKPQQAQQAQRQAQRQQQGDAAAAIAEEQQEHDRLELEMEQDEGSEEEGGSDADTAELALDDRRASGEGGAARRLASAIVQDEYRRRDGRRARSRSRSRSPRRRRSYSPPRGRRASPPRRRSPPPPRGMYWEGATGNRYLGHDPYPFRMGGGWRGREHSPPRRHGSPPLHAGRGHGQWGPQQQPWGEPPGLPRRAYMDEPWARHNDGSSRDGGGGRGVFARLQQQQQQQQQQQHYQHDIRWQEPEAAGAPYAGSGRSPVGPPPGLAAGVPVPGEGSRRPMSAVVGSASAPTMDLSMADETLRQRQQQQAMLAQAPGLAGVGGSISQELPPWERPAYMDLELQRQQQEQQERQQGQQAQQLVQLAGPLAPPSQQQPQDAGLSLSLRPAAVSGHRGPPDDAAAAAFARALTQAAASLGLQGRSVASVPLPMQHSGGQGSTFQITIAQSGQGTRQLSAPLLHQPALQEVLKQRLRQMEIELVKLRAEQAERLKTAQRRQELSTATKLDLTVRSVCIKNVHPAASERVLIAHFGACGFIQRITFLRDPSSGRKTGVAYLQFSSAAEAQAALGLDGSALLQRTIQVVPSDSPAARVAVSRALRSAYPPPGLVPIPVPLFAAPMPPPALRYSLGRQYSRSGGRGGRGGHGGRGHGSFKYVRPADQPAPGSAAAGPAAELAAANGAPAEPVAPGAPMPAIAVAAAAGHGGQENGGELMAE